MKQYLLKVWMTAALSLLALGGVWGQESYTEGYPNVSDITHESAKLNVSASVGGTISSVFPPSSSPTNYSVFIVLDAQSESPTISEVLQWAFDGNGGAIPEGRRGLIGLFSAESVYSLEINSFDPGSSYYVYLVTTNADGDPVIE